MVDRVNSLRDATVESREQIWSISLKESNSNERSRSKKRMLREKKVRPVVFKLLLSADQHLCCMWVDDLAIINTVVDQWF